MAQYTILLYVTAQDEPLGADSSYEGQVPDAEFLAEYLRGAGDYLVPGVTVDDVTVNEQTA